MTGRLGWDFGADGGVFRRVTGDRFDFGEVDHVALNSTLIDVMWVAVRRDLSRRPNVADLAENFRPYVIGVMAGAYRWTKKRPERIRG